MTTHHDHDHDDQHDRGLADDLETLWERRRVLQLLSGVGVVALVGCSDDDEPDSTTAVVTATSTGERTATATSVAVATPIVSPIPTSATPLSACVVIPTETAGPYPGDGSNGPNALTQSGIVRSDIRSSFGTSTNTATGIPLTVALTIVDTKNNCAALAGAAVYLWHCDAQGRYSMYTQGVTNENYCRGVQATDANGIVRFTTVFPAAYTGRWPHIHFEVYPSLATATSSANKLATSQLALPEDVSLAVYATSGYAQSLTNMAQTPLARDNVFSDGVTNQMATVQGNVSAGYTASLVVGI